MYGAYGSSKQESQWERWWTAWIDRTTYIVAHPLDPRLVDGALYSVPPPRCVCTSQWWTFWKCGERSSETQCWRETASNLSQSSNAEKKLNKRFCMPWRPLNSVRSQHYWFAVLKRLYCARTWSERMWVILSTVTWQHQSRAQTTLEAHYLNMRGLFASTILVRFQKWTPIKECALQKDFNSSL